MTDNEKALDILQKLDFFYGQRSGRELWNEKPTDVQNEDIDNFKRDVAFLEGFINRQKEEIERYEKIVGKLAINKDGIAIGTLNGKQTEYIQKSVAEVFRNMAVNRAKAEAVKEFAERLNEASEDTWIDREGDFIYSDSEKSTHEIYDTLAEWCKDVTDNLIKELTEGSDNDGGS